MGLAHLPNLLSGSFPRAHFAVWVLALLPHLLISLFVACKIARFELLFVTILGLAYLRNLLFLVHTLLPM